MSDKPMLFSGPMVRAILSGSKTQTRRIVKPEPSSGVRWTPIVLNGHGGWVDGHGAPLHCRYGKPGYQLWGREPFFAWGRWETRYSAKRGRDEWHFVDMTLECGKDYMYAAGDRQPPPMGGKRHKGGVTPTWWKRPAIFMPRAASRITLEVTDVRIERLQDISEADATAEGVAEWACGACAADNPMGYTDVGYYSLLWEQINGPGSWDANPFVWVVSFKRLLNEPRV